MTTSQALVWLAEIFNTDEALTIDMSRENLEVWDSMATLMLMAELDESYDVTLTESEIGSLDSVSALFSILESHQVIENT